MAMLLKELITKRNDKIIFLSSVAVAIFWLSSININVYKFAVVGAIFEILWLPMVILIYSIPIISFIFFVKSKLNFRSFYLFSILINVAVLWIMHFQKR